MREVYGKREEATQRGRAAAERVRSGWTWEHSVGAVQSRLEALRQMPLAVVRADTASSDVAHAPLKTDKSLTAETEAGPTETDPDSGKMDKHGPAHLPEQPKGSEAGYVVTDKRRTAKTEAGVNQASVVKSATPGKRTFEKRELDAETSLSSTISPNAISPNAISFNTILRCPTISLCMIARNEERVLGDCLASIRPYVDEIILVDTGSTDRTVEIAENFGAKGYHFPWCDDFSAARNVSLSHATGDWVLWMDADDTIPEECGQKLHDLALLAEDKVMGL